LRFEGELRRLEKLEARSTDGSRLVPHSPEWLELWLNQFHLYNTGQPYVTFTIEAMRAMIQALPDDDDAADREVALVPSIAEGNMESRVDQAERHRKRANLNRTNGSSKSSAGIR